MRLSADILPTALLSVAALVLFAGAADALRQGATLPVLHAVEGGADHAPQRFTLGAESFALDSAELPPELTPMLDTVAGALRDSPAPAVRVEVHTDASGPLEAQRSLTQRRADAIKRYLIGRGVDAALLQSVGMGSSAPRRGTDPYAAANRRVEIVRL